MTTAINSRDYSSMDIDWGKRLDWTPYYYQTEKCYKDIASVLDTIAMYVFGIIYTFGAMSLYISAYFFPVATSVTLLAAVILGIATVAMSLCAKSLLLKTGNFWSDPVYCERQGRDALLLLNKDCRPENFYTFEKEFQQLFDRGILKPEDVEAKKIEYFAMKGAARAKIFIEKYGSDAFTKLIANQKDVCKEKLLIAIVQEAIKSEQSWSYWFQQNEQICAAYGWEREEFLFIIARKEVEMKVSYPTLLRHNAEEHLVGMDDEIMELELAHIEILVEWPAVMPLRRTCQKIIKC